jgi:HSP20 family protein
MPNAPRRPHSRGPLDTLTRFRSELDRLFGELLDVSFGASMDAGEWAPPVDVVEHPDTVTLLVELPGMTPDDVELTIAGKTVRIAGTKPGTASPEGSGADATGRFHCVERRQGRFERVIELITAVNTHKARARFVDGVLVVVCPKVEDRRERPRPIPIAALTDED